MSRRKNLPELKPEPYEAILFFGPNGIDKEMRYSEFEAVLDGVVGISEFSSQQSRAAYLRINHQLQVLAVVLFFIEFDETGQADREWNIPLRHLADSGAAGPNLGDGSISLASNSQCPIEWYQGELWDPSAQDDLNYFLEIKNAVSRNKLGFKKIELEDESDVPVIHDVMNVQAQMLDAQKKQLNEEQVKLQIAKLNNSFKEKLYQVEQNRKQEVEQIKRAARNERMSLKQQLMQAEHQLKEKSVLSETLEQKYRKLLKLADEQKKHLSKQKEKTQLLKDEYLEVLEKQHLIDHSESQLAKSLELQVQQLEAEKRNLTDQLTELQHNAENQMEEHAEIIPAFLQQLKDQDLLFVGYQLGAGHMSLSPLQLPEYLESPDVFAARKCQINLENYRAWVQHFENPVCKVCNRTIPKTSLPSDFEIGRNDHCALHHQV